MKRRIFVMPAAGVIVAVRLVVACGADDDSVAIDAGTDVHVEAAAEAGKDAPVDADASFEAGVLEAPTFSPPTGTKTSGSFCVTLSSPVGVIHYTTDDTMPSEQSPIASTPIPVTTNGTTTIRALAVEGTARSAVVSANYIVEVPPVAPEPPTFNPTSTTRDAGFTLRLSIGAADAVICYTLDAGEPRCTSSPYPGFTCVDSGAPVPDAACAEGIAYVDGGIRMAGDAGTTIKVVATSCFPYGSAGDIVTQTYSFE